MFLRWRPPGMSRTHERFGRGRRARAPQARTVKLQVEVLEDRSLLSTSIPLSSTTWTSIGPGPVQNGRSPGREAVTGRVNSVAADPNDANIIYAATAGGGIWKTINGGTSWSALTDAQEVLFMGAIAVAPSDSKTIYAGTGDPAAVAVVGSVVTYPDIFYGVGLLKSTDAGATWTVLNRVNFAGRSITKILVDPTDPNTVFAAVSDNLGALGVAGGKTGNTGIWKTADGGGSWVNITNTNNTTTKAPLNPAGTADFTDIVIDPTNNKVMYMAIGDPAGANNGVFKSIDGGNTWFTAGNFTQSVAGIHHLAISPTNNQLLYASNPTAGGRVFVTNTGGANWVATAKDPTNYLTGKSDYYSSTLILDPNDTTSKTLIVGGTQDTVTTPNIVGSRVFRTTDAGATAWADISGVTTTNGPFGHIHGMDIDRNGKIIVGSDGGVWRLESPSGPSWRNLNGNLSVTQLTHVAAHPSDANIAFAGARSHGLSKFNDKAAWSFVTGVNTGLGYAEGGVIRFDPTTPQTVYAEPAAVAAVAFERSDDGGTTWSSKAAGITGTPDFYSMAFDVDARDPNRLLVGTTNVLESLDKGATYTSLTFPASAVALTNIAAAKTDINTVYTTRGGDVIITRSHGANWVTTTPIVNPPAGLIWRDLVVDPSNADTAYVVTNNFKSALITGTVFRTTNGGTSWSSLSTNLPDLPVWTIALDTRGAGTGDDVIYVGTDQGVYVTTNLGLSWSRFGQGLPNAQVRDLEYNADLNILTAATYGRGTWQIQPSVPTNPPLVAQNDAFQTPINNTLAVFAPGLLSNDTDPTGLVPNAVLDTSPTSGRLTTFQGNGAFTYVPNTGFNGIDTFTYHLNNGLFTSNVATVTIAVGNVAPTATNDSYTTPASTTLVVNAPGVLANDTDANSDPLLALLDSNVSNGTLVLNSNGSFTYVPSTGFNGTDSFTYHASDGKLNSATVTVSIVVGTGGGGGGGGSTAADLIAVGADAGGSPIVTVLDALTTQRKFSIAPYDLAFTGGVRVATGDVNGDGTNDIITAPGPGGAPHIRVFDGKTGNALASGPSSFFALDPAFPGGVYVAAGDVNGDGKADIIAGADAGGAPMVQIFNGANGLVIRSFLAYDPAFPGGVRVGTGDVNGDGFSDIITGPGSGGGPHVMVYSGKDGVTLRSFLVFDPLFAGGIYVAGGDVNGDGRADIVVGAGAGGGPQVRTFDGLNSANVLNTFFAFDPAFAGGVRVGTADLDGDGRADLLASAGPGASPLTRGLDALSLASLDSFFALDATFQGGIFVNGRGR